MQHKQFCISEALNWAKAQLSAHGVSDDGLHDSTAIDSKVLVAASIQQEVVYLHTWPEKRLTDSQQKKLEDYVNLRILGHPVAHIIGYRDFWSLRLNVSPATLIPRPETELLVEIALNLQLNKQAKVLDLGTGTGAIALALASEHPNWQITGVDKSDEAISLAQENAALNGFEQVTFKQSDWFSALENQQFELIVSNPPYIEKDHQLLELGDVRFEPSSALTSGADGLDDIRKIVSQSQSYLVKEGWLVIEHGYQQRDAVSKILKSCSFRHIRCELDLNALPRVTLAQI